MIEATIKIDRGTHDITHNIKLPDYGEVRIIIHAGKITFVETTTKEKVE